MSSVSMPRLIVSRGSCLAKADVLVAAAASSTGYGHDGRVFKNGHRTTEPW